MVSFIIITRSEKSNKPCIAASTLFLYSNKSMFKEFFLECIDIIRYTNAFTIKLFSVLITNECVFQLKYRTK